MSATLTLSVNDLGNTGTGGPGIDADTATLAITAENDAPGADIGMMTHTVNGIVPLALHGTGLAVSDPDAGVSPIRAVLSVGEGTLDVIAGGTGVTVSGTGGATVNLDGTVAQINALLAGSAGASVNYIAALAPTAATALTLSVDDLGNTGSGGALGAIDASTLNILAPSVLVPDPEPDPEPMSVPDPESKAEPDSDANPDPVADPAPLLAPSQDPELIHVSGPAPGSADGGVSTDYVEAPTSVQVPPDFDSSNTNEMRAAGPDRGTLDLLRQIMAQGDEVLFALEDSRVRALPLAQVQASLLQALDNVRDEGVTRAAEEQLLVASTVSVSTGLSVGYVAWLLRGGVLLSSILSSLPAWRALDPLPVLGRMDDDEDDDDLNVMVERDELDDAQADESSIPTTPALERARAGAASYGDPR
jgi:hypothetical protein